MFDIASAASAERRLKECEAALADYSERVFEEQTKG
jgi:hypothetical protein